MTKVALISMWIALQYGEEARWVYYGEFFEAKCLPGAPTSNTHLRKPRSSLINVPDKAQRWIALLGRSSGAPTDGVEDYCVRLREALKKKGALLEVVRVPLAELGWLRSLRWLRKRFAGKDIRVALLQYSALSWSRWGFPIGVLLVVWTLKHCGFPVVVVFHDTEPVSGARLRDRVRRGVQTWVMRQLVRSTLKSVSALPVDRLKWLPAGPQRHKFTLIPIGSNMSDGLQRMLPSARKDSPGIAVFGVDRNRTIDEAAQIGRIVSSAAREVGPVRLAVFGLGAREAEAALRTNLEGALVALEVHGILPPDEVCERLLDCSVQIFIRSGISACRGSVVAGICCGLAVVGWEDWDTAYPITEAGLLTAPSGDEATLIKELTSVLIHEAIRVQLTLRSSEAAREYFSWDSVAARFQAEVGILAGLALDHVRYSKQD
jgi:glycosyltransferase involved in cell wall biosynthesis